MTLQHFKDQFQSLLMKAGRVAIAYHSDSDGVCSSKILIDFVKSEGKKREQFSFYPVNNNLRHLTAEQEEAVCQLKPDLLLYLDLGNNEPSAIKRLRQKIPSVVSVDHHSYPEGWANHFSLYINSALIPGLRRPQHHCSARLLGSLLETGRNYWVEVIGLEGDIVIPSMPGTMTWEVGQILNLLGLTKRDDESEADRITRSDRLLNIMLESDLVNDFLSRFQKEKDLKTLYDQMQEDIAANLRQLHEADHKLTPMDGGHLYIHHISSRTGFEIIGHILKEHFPLRATKTTTIFTQSLQKKDTYQIFLSTSHHAVNCYEIARSGGGGGHEQRAGYGFQGDLTAELERVTRAVQEMMKTKPFQTA